jgi:cytochrome P450
MDFLRNIAEDVFLSADKFPTLISSSMVAFLFLLGLFGWIFALLPRSSTKDASSAHSVPMVEGGYPIIGHALEFGSNPEQFLQRCKDQYGSIFGCTIMGRTFIFLDGTYKDTFFASAASELSFFDAVMLTVVPQFTIGMDSMLHQWHVPLIRRQMAPNNVTQYYSTLQEQIQRILLQELGSLNEGESFEHDDVQGLTGRIVAACSAVSFLGPQLGQQEEILHVFRHYHSACFHVMNLAAILPHSILWIFARNVNKYKLILRRWVVPEVEKRRAANSIKQGNDLLSVMIHLTDKGQLFTAEQIADRCMTLIFASMVTTAGALRHAVYDLAGHWDRLSERLLQEQEEVTVIHGPDITPAALGVMPQLNAFMNESMRLSALPIQQTRVFMNDGSQNKSLMETNHNFRLPQGATVCLSGYLATHDPNIFPEPREFRMERFLQNGENDPSTLGLFPFGIGRHACPGRHFAWVEVQATLCTLLRQYKVRTVSGKVPKYHRIPIDTTRVQEPVQFSMLTPKDIARIVQ